MRSGRPRKDGERYACGKIKPRKKLKPDLEPISGVLWQRMKQHGKQAGLDPRITTELGRLNWFGELTVAMTAAGFRIAEIYGRYERYKRLSRSVRSPSYNASYGEAGTAEELLGDVALAELEQRIIDATTAYERLVGKVEGYQGRPDPGLIPRHLRNPIETLCVEDRAINPTLYDDIREFLQQLAIVWKIQSAPSTAGGNSAVANRHGPALHFNKHEEIEAPAGQEKAAPKRPNLDRIFWIQVARVIAPHLDTQELGIAYDMQQALKAREIFRRAKERKAGSNVVPFNAE